MMFQRILVPLDGSARAEHALSIAARIARASRGSVTLLHVVTHPIDAAAYFMQPPDATENTLNARHTKATDYLTALAASSELAGVVTTQEVADSMPAQTIISAARLQSVDLIVMCSHGTRGFQHWALGSIAQKVARHSPVPVLVLHEGVDGQNTGPSENARSVRVLVTLDRSPLAEAALAPAAYLSAALSAPAQGTIHLIQVLPFDKVEGERQGESFTTAHQQVRTDTQAYLTTIEQRLREGEMAHLHLHVTSSVALGMDVADTLIKRAEADEQMKDTHETQGYDIMAMATHGREGSELWTMGSVTERVLNTIQLPLLLVRPQKREAQNEEEGWMGLL